LARIIRAADNSPKPKDQQQNKTKGKNHMAAIPVTIKGTILKKAPKGGEVSGSGLEACIINGSLSLTGLEVDNSPPGPQPVPPDPIEPPDPAKAWEAKTFWTPANGWQVVLVPTDEALVPTPS